MAAPPPEISSSIDGSLSRTRGRTRWCNPPRKPTTTTKPVTDHKWLKRADLPFREKSPAALTARLPPCAMIQLEDDGRERSFGMNPRRGIKGDGDERGLLLRRTFHPPPTPRERERWRRRGRPRWFGLVWFVVAVRECDLARLSLRVCAVLVW
jgi:hypothetical protein